MEDCVHSGNGHSRRNFEELERRRLEAVELLKKGFSQAEVARRVSASRESVRRWARIASSGRFELLGKVKPGRKPKLTPEQLEKFRALLGSRTGDVAPWTLKEVATLIANEFGVEYRSSHVCWLLQRILGCERKRRSEKSVLNGHGFK